MLMLLKASILTLVLAAAEEGNLCAVSPGGCTANSGDAEQDPNTLLQTRASIGEADKVDVEGSGNEVDGIMEAARRQLDAIVEIESKDSEEKFIPAAKPEPKCATYTEPPELNVKVRSPWAVVVPTNHCPQGCKWDGAAQKCEEYAWTAVPGFWCHKYSGVHRNVASPQECQDYCREGCMGISYTKKMGGGCVTCKTWLQSVIPDTQHGFSYYAKNDDYTVGSPNVNGCLPGYTEITTETECKEALTTLSRSVDSNKKWKRADKFKYAPKGCVLWENSDGYLNTDPDANGLSSGRQQPICKKPASPATP